MKAKLDNMYSILTRHGSAPALPRPGLHELDGHDCAPSDPPYLETGIEQEYNLDFTLASPCAHVQDVEVQTSVALDNTLFAQDVTELLDNITAMSLRILTTEFLAKVEALPSFSVVSEETTSLTEALAPAGEDTCDHLAVAHSLIDKTREAFTQFEEFSVRYCVLQGVLATSPWLRNVPDSDMSTEDAIINSALQRPLSRSTYLQELHVLETTFGTLLAKVAQFMCTGVGMAATSWPDLKRIIIRTVSTSIPGEPFTLCEVLCKASSHPI